MKQGTPLLALCMLLWTGAAVAVQRYGHAYQSPADFTEQQYHTIAANYPIFTVEKRHASGVYGNASLPAPFKTNSILASTMTARKLKALNSSIKVLMYWNSVLHYNMYECEVAVQPNWLQHPSPDPKGRAVYNYSVPEFRQWWVDCAVGAVANSSGALSGLFLDAVPKVETLQNSGMKFWGEMVDSLMKRLPTGSFVIYNGYFFKSNLAGPEALVHASSAYCESLARDDQTTPSQIPSMITFLQWLAAGTMQFPNKPIVGHGSAKDSASFTFGLSVFLLVTPDANTGYYLANDGYNIDQGMLTPYNYNVGLGAAKGNFTVVDKTAGILHREFEQGSVTVNLKEHTGTISNHQLQLTF